MLSGLSDKKIILLLNTNWGRRACREIIRRKDGFIPLLINILDQTINDPSFNNNDLHIPAALLLAQMREPQAYSRLVKLIAYDEKGVDLLWGDLLTEHYVEMLRDTFNGDSSLIPQLAENHSVEPFARSMALYAWGMHYGDGHISRDDITRYFRHLIHDVYTGKPNNNDKIVLSAIAYCIREHQLDELIDEVKTIYDRNGIDKLHCGNCNEYVNDFNNSMYRATHEHIDDAIHVLQKWGWFKKSELSEDFEEDYDDFDEDDD